MKYFLILKFAIEKNTYIYNAVWIELGNVFFIIWQKQASSMRTSCCSKHIALDINLFKEQLSYICYHCKDKLAFH